MNIRGISLVIVFASIFACTSRQRYDDLVLSSYRVGMTREEAHTLLAQAQLMTAVSRPAEGWPASDATPSRVGRAASQFELSHKGTVVHSCEVYWVGRATSVPMVPGGVWWDYLFYDKQDKLVGYVRRFLD